MPTHLHISIMFHLDKIGHKWSFLELDRLDPSLSIDVWRLQGNLSARRQGCRKANKDVNAGALSLASSCMLNAEFKKMYDFHKER